jgi:hypothetical protein
LPAVRRGILLFVLAGLFAGATALAQGRGGESTSALRDGAVLHLERARTCGANDLVTLRVTPGGVELGWISVRLDGRQMVRLTGVSSDASVTLRIPQSGGRLGVSAETLDGRRLVTGRRYDSCRPAPAPPRRGGPPPTIVGGGEA